MRLERAFSSRGARNGKTVAVSTGCGAANIPVRHFCGEEGRFTDDSVKKCGLKRSKEEGRGLATPPFQRLAGDRLD